MNLESIKRKLLVKYPFFGSVVVNSNFIAEPTIQTAGTDGKNIYYNPNFIESINDEEQTFIFAHEICHIAFNHIFRSEGKDKDLWNIATDAVVNAFLRQDGLPIVFDGVDIPDAINYDAEEMYQKLLDEREQQSNEQDNVKDQNNNQQHGDNSQKQEHKEGKQQNRAASESENEQQASKLQQQSSNSKSSQEQNKQAQGQNNDGRQSKNSQDEKSQQEASNNAHSMWDKAVEKKHQEEQQEKQQPTEKQNEKNEEIKKLTKLGEKEVFKQNKIERRKQLEKLRKVLASQSHGYGDTTNSERRIITDIGVSKPLIDWRRLLKEAIKYDVDWSYQNAEIENGVVTAYLEEIPKSETEIVLDTSGSIDEILLRNFLRECKNILQTSKVKVGCFDTKFYGFTEIRNMSDIDNLPFYGGGGTNFDVAVNAFTRRVENKIIFTDGEALMPIMPMDAIWIVFGWMEIKPPGGKVIYLDDEQLERLYNYKSLSNSKRKLR